MDGDLPGQVISIVSILIHLLYLPVQDFVVSEIGQNETRRHEPGERPGTGLNVRLLQCCGLVVPFTNVVIDGVVLGSIARGIHVDFIP